MSGSRGEAPGESRENLRQHDIRKYSTLEECEAAVPKAGQLPKRIVFAFDGLDSGLFKKKNQTMLYGFTDRAWADPELRDNTIFLFFDQANVELATRCAAMIARTSYGKNSQGQEQYPSILTLGYSNGVRGAVDFSYCMQIMKVSVDGAFTLDGAPRGLIGSSLFDNPGSVKSWVNWRQTSFGLGHALIKGPHVRNETETPERLKEYLERTSGRSLESKPKVDHFTMPTDPQVNEELLAFLKNTPIGRSSYACGVSCENEVKHGDCKKFVKRWGTGQSSE
jgi:hypothetical protein